MALTGNSILDNPNTHVVAIGSINITDIYDATPIQAFIIPQTTSANSSQVYDKLKDVYNPDYTKSPFVGKLTLLKAGTNTDISSGMDVISWYVETNSVTVPITDPSLSGMFSVSGTKNETVSLVKNLSQDAITLKGYTNFNDNEKHTITPVYATYTITRSILTKTSITLYNYTPNGFIFMNGNPGSVTLNTQVYMDGAVDNTKKRTYSWFRQDTSVTSTDNPNYDSRMGLGWAKVTLSYATAKPGSEFNTPVTIDATLTVMPDDIVNFETYALVTTPTEGEHLGRVYKSFFTVYDYDATMVVNIDSPNGFIYKGGAGSKTLQARVYTSTGEIDQDGTKYVYRWYSYAPDGTMNTNFGGNGVAFKSGKIITVNATEFGDQAQLVVETLMA